MNKHKLIISRRSHIPVWFRALNILLFAFLALAFCSIFMVMQGLNPFRVYFNMFRSAFGSANGWSKSILAGIPLMICGLGVSIAFRMNLNNIGAEGQFAMGAIASAGFILFGPKIPSSLQIPVMIVLSLLAGAGWALIAALLKAFWNVNETIVTLMLNYIALLFLDYLCYGPWKGAGGLNLPYTANIPETAQMPMLFGGSFSSAFLIAVAVAVFLFWLFRYTTIGYQIDVIKNSTNAARYAGMNVRKNILIVLTVSGALCGLTGAVQVSSVIYRLQPNLPNGAGYTAIIIAYLSKFNPLAIILVSIFFGGLDRGAYAVQIDGVPSQVATMIRGAILIFVIASEFFTQYRIKRTTMAMENQTKQKKQILIKTVAQKEG
ncbi:ABC transporter permease [Chordicoccus furentiruminis]|uniref:ABC transporter permease n=1 Tax=Chordicoccus furentiruminis TaxID=2709410 RepID=UPI0023A8C232|nr:ABC transporter permease [Chordicoccus furentiruminis]